LPFLSPVVVNIWYETGQASEFTLTCWEKHILKLTPGNLATTSSVNTLFLVYLTTPSVAKIV
jgi:hypothetical protein